MKYLIVLAIGSIVLSMFVLTQKDDELREAKDILFMYSKVMTYYGTNCDFVTYKFVTHETTPHVDCIKLQI